MKQNIFSVNDKPLTQVLFESGINHLSTLNKSLNMLYSSTDHKKAVLVCEAK